jgi:AcrR family transcriptional regulator
MSTRTARDQPQTGPRQVRRRPGGRSARVRAAVLDATTEVLAEHGYERLSFEEVAQRAGVHKTTVYRRWASRPELVLDALHARSDLIIELPDSGRIEADLTVFLQSVADNLDSPLGRALLIATIRSSDEGAEAASVRHSFWRERFDRARVRLDRARRGGEIARDADVPLLVESLVSPIFFRALVSGEPVDDDVVQSHVRLVLSTARTTVRGGRAR